MPRYLIIAEGFVATGESSRATQLGSEYGKDFKAACNNLARKDQHFRNNYNPDNLTYWGCKLYPNWEEARRSFG